MNNPTDHHDTITQLARSLALEHKLDVDTCMIVNAARFESDVVNPVVWHRFTSCLTVYFNVVTQKSWPVELLQADATILRQHTTSNAVAFESVRAMLTSTLTTTDPRVAFWARERPSIRKLQIFIPPETDPVLDRIKKALVEWVPRSARPDGKAFQHFSDPDTRTLNDFHDEIDSALSASDNDARQAPQAKTNRNDAPDTTSATPTSNFSKDFNMGNTFNLNDVESNKRTLYQFWVWNEDTDEVLDHASVIVAGDTDQEATSNLKQLLKHRLADKPATGNVRFTVHKIESFAKTPKDERISLDAMLNKMRDVLASTEGAK